MLGKVKKKHFFLQLLVPKTPPFFIEVRKSLGEGPRFADMSVKSSFFLRLPKVGPKGLSPFKGLFRLKHFTTVGVLNH